MTGLLGPMLSVLTLLAVLLAAMPGQAAPQHGAYAGPVRVVGDDGGGRLRPRLAEVRQLRASGVRVEIRGDYCLSSCTLYLGAGNVCVRSGTSFGFHGPTYLYEPIRYDRFDYWSRRMAAHYPPELRHWFLSRARFVTHGYVTLSGADLIRMGVPRCRG
ncbi:MULTISPECIES: hypothetical protein [Salipiger]|uniref:hypothetical protein n=1 Tax=Salipiger TaxID=263377 RepID=UPI003515AF29